MSKEKIQQIAEENLAGHLEEPGSILYSSHETLKPGVVYVLGFNPGGSCGDPIKKSIDNLLTKTENAYLDEIWENQKKKGGAPLQKRVEWILKNINLNLRDVCASNLIFFQSKNANDIDYSLADKCWPVHEAILGIVKPKMILTFGNSESPSSPSPFKYLHSKFGGEKNYVPAKYGNWNLKSFRCDIGGKNYIVAGLPHLSYYSPIGKDHVIEWLDKLKESKN